MPESNEETGTKSHPTGLLRIVAWWRKFHFSGRVIMCSVLLGLGLILIGALIFVINMDDDSNKPKVDGNSSQLPTKAPSNYSGPVVMGIGSFIVIVGVTMCLFETQVCRKKTGDASPLICERTDDLENKSSDPTSVPSTSHGHKLHRQGARKGYASPRKSKHRHGKSRSRERNPQKSPSPSHPVSIESPKNFITSSEDNFLTPPNTLDENATLVKTDNLPDAEGKNSSLMKSFTSSDPSWNQSTEFITPSTSFRDTSVSLNNSIEIERNHDENSLGNELSEKQSINSEFVTPLTIEEHRIQQLLMRVKNEQKQMSDSEKQISVETVENLSSKANLDSQMIHNEIIKNEKQSDIKSVKVNSSHDELNSATGSGSLMLEDDKNKKTPQDEELQGTEQIKNENKVTEENVEINIDKPANDTSDEIAATSDVKLISQHENQEKNCQSDLTPTLLENTNNYLGLSTDKEALQVKEKNNDEKVDFDSSVSSNETIVSPDAFHENVIKDNISTENTSSSSLKENPRNESEDLKTSKSTDNDATISDSNLTQTDILNEDKVEIQDINVNESLETLSNKEKTTKEMENESKATSS